MQWSWKTAGWRHPTGFESRPLRHQLFSLRRDRVAQTRCRQEKRSWLAGFVGQAVERLVGDVGLAAECQLVAWLMSSMTVASGTGAVNIGGDGIAAT